jgi:hypothetical protein
MEVAESTQNIQFQVDQRTSLYINVTLSKHHGDLNIGDRISVIKSAIFGFY